MNAGGRCELFGRKILLDDMTIDHIKPYGKSNGYIHVSDGETEPEKIWMENHT